MPAGLFPDGARVSPGPGVGPVPASPRDAAHLPARSLAARGAAPERGREVESRHGLLVCGSCGRWYPIDGGIPELLPDHLRDATRERALFDAALAGAPPDLRDALAAFTPSGDATSDPGAHYKQAEIGIKNKIDDPVFFGPGYSSPFNPWNSDFTIYLIALFGAVAPMLDVTRGRPSSTAAAATRGRPNGCSARASTRSASTSAAPISRSASPASGRSGRTWSSATSRTCRWHRPRPTPSSPTRASTTFPTGAARWRSYDRVLRDGGTVILAEPGGAHEDAKVSVDAMEKYGILERGMELDDVAGYAEGTTFGAPEQLFLLRVAEPSWARRSTRAFFRQPLGLPTATFPARQGGAEAAPPHATGRRGRDPARRRRQTARAAAAQSPRTERPLGARRHFSGCTGRPAWCILSKRLYRRMFRRAPRAIPRLVSDL